MSWFQNESNRAWLYRVLLAVAAAAVVFGVVTGEESEALVAIATAALLGNGLAAKNTST
jgi:small-conductance mechanosensitive channel